MLLDGHQLDAVVAAANDVREHVVCKLSVLRNSSMLGAHAHMCLVDLKASGFGLRALVLEGVVLTFGWVEENRIIQVRVAVLLHKRDPGWISFFLKFKTNG